MSLVSLHCSFCSPLLLRGVTSSAFLISCVLRLVAFLVQERSSFNRVSRAASAQNKIVIPNPRGVRGVRDLLFGPCNVCGQDVDKAQSQI